MEVPGMRRDVEEPMTEIKIALVLIVVLVGLLCFLGLRSIQMTGGAG